MPRGFKISEKPELFESVVAHRLYEWTVQWTQIIVARKLNVPFNTASPPITNLAVHGDFLRGRTNEFAITPNLDMF